MGARLIAMTTGQEYHLQDFNVIGRGDDATLRIENIGISRQHATIRHEGAHYWLVDLGSTNGTFVNDFPLTTARVLNDGDWVQFGSDCFRFVQEDVGERDPGSAASSTNVSRHGPTPVKKQPITLLVGDLCGFTQLGSRVGADVLAELLSEWYADCNVIMRHHGAMIDKFIGDCVFAYWPGVDANQRVKAVAAARALRDSELSNNSPGRLTLEAGENITLDCRVGLHVGEVVMGALGKGVNTAVGDAVNVAFRIESVTRQLDCGVLASAAFVMDWPAGLDLFEPRGSYAVKGHPDKIEVFALKA